LHRSRRNGLKRMGLLALALVLALGALGVAYSAWTDSVYVNSTVEMGTLDIDAIGAYSSFVYKVPDAAGPGSHFEIIKISGIDPPVPPPEDGTLVATALATYENDGSDADTGAIVFSGIFPGIEITADLELEYYGTIPAKISFAQVSPVDLEDPDYDDDEAAIIEALWELGETSGQTQGIWIDGEKVSYPSGEVTEFRYPGSTLGVLGVQLDQFDTITITMHLYLPLITGDPGNPLDESNLVGRDNIDFGGQVTVLQWNEYEEP
jgi:hypothetical protein